MTLVLQDEMVLFTHIPLFQEMESMYSWILFSAFFLNFFICKGYTLKAMMFSFTSDLLKSVEEKLDIMELLKAHSTYMWTLSFISLWSSPGFSYTTARKCWFGTTGFNLWWAWETGTPTGLSESLMARLYCCANPLASCGYTCQVSTSNKVHFRVLTSLQKKAEFASLKLTFLCPRKDLKMSLLLWAL